MSESCSERSPRVCRNEAYIAFPEGRLAESYRHKRASGYTINVFSLRRSRQDFPESPVFGCVPVGLGWSELRSAWRWEGTHGWGIDKIASRKGKPNEDREMYIGLSRLSRHLRWSRSINRVSRRDRDGAARSYVVRFPRDCTPVIGIF